MKKRLSIFNKLCLLIMSIGIFAHMPARADIDPSVVAVQLEKNIKSAFMAAEVEMQMASKNAAFQAFDVMPMLLAVFSPGIAILDNIVSSSLHLMLNYLFDEKNIIERTQFELTYSLRGGICELFNDKSDNEKSIIFNLCQYIMEKNMVKVRVRSEDNLAYEIVIEGREGVQNDIFVVLKSFLSSPNLLGGSLNLSGIHGFMREVFQARPELGAIFNGLVQQLSGKVEGHFAFSTPEGRAQCRDKAKACLSFNIAEPVTAMLMEGTINLYSWNSSPKDQSTISILSFDDTSMRIDINSGAIDLSIPFSQIALKHGRLQGSVTFNPTDTEGYSSLELSKIVIQNLSLEKGENELSIEDVTLRMCEGINVDRATYCETKEGAYFSAKSFDFIVDVIKDDKEQSCVYEENWKLCIGDLENLQNIISFDQRGSEDVAISVPYSNSKFAFLESGRGLVITKKALKNSIGMVTGVIQVLYNYGLKLPGRDLIHLGSSSFAFNQGDFLTVLQ